VIRVAGVVLCGGQSRRMGRSKAWLPLGDETLLQRVVRLVREAAWPVVVVAAKGQSLPTLPADVRMVRDERDEAGPLEGLRVGLAALAESSPTDGRSNERRSTDGDSTDGDSADGDATRAGSSFEAIFATACDTPLLCPGVIRFLAGELGEHWAAVPVAGAHFHPLTAVYRPAALAMIESLIARGESRLSALCDQPGVRAIPVDRLRAVDPRLDTLLNINRPEEYAALMRR
jgi:molybdopterin-guanine dinucleotide biosynthesis protein A